MCDFPNESKSLHGHCFLEVFQSGGRIRRLIGKTLNLARYCEHRCGIELVNRYYYDNNKQKTLKLINA